MHRASCRSGQTLDDTRMTQGRSQNDIARMQARIQNHSEQLPCTCFLRSLQIEFANKLQKHMNTPGHARAHVRKRTRTHAYYIYIYIVTTTSRNHLFIGSRTSCSRIISREMTYRKASRRCVLAPNQGRQIRTCRMKETIELAAKTRYFANFASYLAKLLFEKPK